MQTSVKLLVTGMVMAVLMVVAVGIVVNNEMAYASKGHHPSEESASILVNKVRPYQPAADKINNEIVSANNALA